MTLHFSSKTPPLPRAIKVHGKVLLNITTKDAIMRVKLNVNTISNGLT